MVDFKIFSLNVREKVKILVPNRLIQAEMKELAQVICDTDSEEEIADDADTSTDEYIEGNDDNSDLEMEGSNSEDLDEAGENNKQHVAKDKVTSWHKISLRSKFNSGRCKVKNI